MREGGGGDEAVFYGHGVAFFPQPGEETCPCGGARCVEVEDAEALDAASKPVFEPGAAATGGKEQDAIFEFAEDDGVHG